MRDWRKEGEPVKYGKWVLVVVGLWAALTGCHAGSTFDGSVASNDEGVRMDYVILDRRESVTICLEEGDSLRVSVAQEAGTVDVTVGMEGQNPVYEGKGLTDFDFTLGIPESGTYQISVTGHGARGSVAFLRVTEQSLKTEKCAARAPDWEGAWAARL